MAPQQPTCNLLRNLPYHGISLPLFSLHSQKSCGIGEFLDLIPIIDWCHDLGFEIIQLLPLNDSGTNTSPYSIISSKALHPIYISLSALPQIHEETALQELKAFNVEKRVPVLKVLEKKLKFLRLYCHKNEHLFRKDSLFLTFQQENSWLKPYALFRVLKEQSHHLPINLWSDSEKEPSSSLYKQYEQQMFFYEVLQYLCYKQLKEVSLYAKKKKVFLKGDFPFFVDGGSVDVWEKPQLFNSEFYAGAPPDFYTQEGQNWKSPPFAWDKASPLLHRWWQERLSYGENFYSIYRIDHVLGFFRTWLIPKKGEARDGFFLPKDRAEWEKQGKEALSYLVSSSSMVPIAEDLGMVPECLAPTLLSLNICGTKVLRWQQDFLTKTLIPYDQYPRLSMTTVSTHDSGTLSLWWKESPNEAKAFCKFKGWTYHKQISLEQLKEILKDSHTTNSLFHINPLQEYLALFPELVAASPEEERINQPGTVNSHNWSYRICPTVEELISNSSLKRAIWDLLH